MEKIYVCKCQEFTNSHPYVILTDSVGAILEIEYQNGKFMVTSTYFGDDGDNKISAEINFCPLCGKKLEKNLDNSK